MGLNLYKNEVYYVFPIQTFKSLLLEYVNDNCQRFKYMMAICAFVLDEHYLKKKTNHTNKNSLYLVPKLFLLKVDRR